jgi:hypothetical protein
VGAPSGKSDLKRRNFVLHVWLITYHDRWLVGLVHEIEVTSYG